MSTHTKVRTSWVATQPVLHGEFAALDFGQFDSLSASGGSYAPATPIVVGGAGMTLFLVGPNYQIGGSFNVTSGALLTVNFGCNFTTGGANTFASTSVTDFIAGSQLGLAGHVIVSSGGDVAISSGATVQCDVGAILNVDGTLTVSSAATVSFACTSTFTGIIATTVSCSAGISAAALNVSGASSLDTVALTGPLTPTGTFGQILSRTVFGTDTNMAVSKSTAEIVFIRSAVLTAPRTYTLDTTGALVGSVITFINHDIGGSDVTVRQTGGALIGVLSVIPTHGYHWFDLLFTGSIWEILRFAEV